MGPDDLTSEVTGEIEKDGAVLVVRRIHVKYTLKMPEDKRETAKGVHEMHADRCPVARSIKGAIAVTTEVEFR